MIRELTLAAALTLAAGSAGAQQAYMPVEGVCNSSSFWRDWCSTVKAGKTPAVSCEKGSGCKAVPTEGTPFDQEFDKRIWWQSCALSRKCSDWVRSGLPYPPTTPQDGLDCAAGPAGYLVCQSSNRTITCKERSDCAAIASVPSNSSWHIQIRRGGLTHDNCEDIRKGAEAEGATGECFQ